VVELYEKREAELSFTLKLAGLGVALKGEFGNKGPEFILFREGAQLELIGCETQEEALLKLFELEKSRPSADVVYVPSTTTEEIRSTYKNYYDDAHDFLSWVAEGAEYLRSLK
jgi:hypothetical protein